MAVLLECKEVINFFSFFASGDHHSHHLDIVLGRGEAEWGQRGWDGGVCDGNFHPRPAESHSSKTLVALCHSETVDSGTREATIIAFLGITAILHTFIHPWLRFPLHTARLLATLPARQ